MLISNLTDLQVEELPDKTFITLLNNLNNIPDRYKRGEAAKAFMDLIGWNFDLADNELFIHIIFNPDTPKAQKQWAILANIATPYHSDNSPLPATRLLYFPNSKFFESTIVGCKITWDGYTSKLIHMRAAGNPGEFHLGTGSGSTDFYFADQYLVQAGKTGRDVMVYIDFKFIPMRMATSPESFKQTDMFKKKKHSHNGRLLLIFIEAEEKYYIIDLYSGEYKIQNLPIPSIYLDSVTTQNAKFGIYNM